jgi:hypothetical protein
VVADLADGAALGALHSFAADELGALRDEREWVLVFLSRALNVLAGGSPRELFCGRAYREGWVVCGPIDALFRVLRPDDLQHCRACYLGDRRFRGRR